MKRIRFQFQQLNIIQVGIILLITSLFFGIVSANLFRDTLVRDIIDYELSIYANINNNPLEYSKIFWYILLDNLKQFLIFWMLSITILGIPYMAFKICSFGFLTGFYISVVSLQYGFKGLLLILVSEFPQGLIYLPIGIICLYKGYELTRKIYHDNRSHLMGLLNIIKPYLMLILILVLGILVGSFIEAYIGSFLMKKTIGLFV
ncbi:MAG TPA: hypothetical protein GXZ21_11150 [Clostridiales bacterium]|nr:hypothetical protein [Clostridiales bacterium]